MSVLQNKAHRTEPKNPPPPKLLGSFDLCPKGKEMLFYSDKPKLPCKKRRKTQRDQMLKRTPPPGRSSARSMMDIAHSDARALNCFAARALRPTTNSV